MKRSFSFNGSLKIIREIQMNNLKSKYPVPSDGQVQIYTTSIHAKFFSFENVIAHYFFNFTSY